MLVSPLRPLLHLRLLLTLFFMYVMYFILFIKESYRCKMIVITNKNIIQKYNKCLSVVRIHKQSKLHPPTTLGIIIRNNKRNNVRKKKRIEGS